MKNRYLLLAMICFANFSFAQLTVVSTPPSATVCAGNSVSLSASATPVGYTMSAIANNVYDPTLFATNILVDQANFTVVPVSSGTLDDGRWDNISIPFTFRFYGNTFNSVNISTNGWVGLGSTNSVTTGYGPLPNAGAPNNVIHGINADLTFVGGTNTAILQYFEVGSAPNRKFVVDYSNIKFFGAASNGTTANVQIILYETTNVVEIHTTSCDNLIYAKTQGIENSTGSVYTAVTGRNGSTTWAGTGMPNAYRFTPDNIGFTWSPATGLNTTTGANVIATPATTTTYTISATNPANGHTGNTTVTVTVDPASYSLAAVAGGPSICQNTIVSGSGTSYRDGNCNLILKVAPAGASPVANTISTCVRLATGSTKRGTTTLYLARQYDAEPLFNAATSTANITLYYKQSEFDNFNLKATDSGHKALPTGPADATGISNLRLRQFHGTGTNPTNYTGASQDFSTSVSGFTVVWNATRTWWEVTVPVTGFSGFYITSALLGTLPITLEYFKGVQVDSKHLLSWKANCTSASVTFEIQRSGDGVHFTPIATINADQARCSQPFDYNDQQPLSGMNYYRIRVIDVDAKYYFSNTLSFMLKARGFEVLNISPNPVVRDNAVLKINAGEKTQANVIISDVTGRVVSNQKADLIPGINQVVLQTQSLSKGTYQVTTYSPGMSPKTLMMIKQ